MNPATPQRLRLSSGTELAFITAGETSKPAVPLLHGFPNSAREFRDVIMRAPELVSGLVIRNANAHRTGFGPSGTPN